MSDSTPTTLSRRRFLRRGGGAVALGVAGLGSASGVALATTSGARPGRGWGPATSAQGGALDDIAYCVVLENGNWVGPRDANGDIDPTLIRTLAGVARSFHVPRYLRFTEPNGRIGHEVPAQGSQELALTRELVDAGLKLGVAINVALEGSSSGGCEASPSAQPKKPGRCVRSFDSVIDQAKGIRAESDAAGGIYDWIFLDFAWDRTPAGPYGLNDLQQMVDELGRIGWARVMINATGFGQKHFTDIPHRAWASAREFSLFAGTNWQTASAAALAGHGEALSALDTAYVSFMHHQRPDVHTVLKLEDPTETQRFGSLSTSDQLQLLERWARAGDELGYSMIYPLFIDGNDPLGNQANQYDSQTARTFWPQLELMQRNG